MCNGSLGWFRSARVMMLSMKEAGAQYSRSPIDAKDGAVIG